MQEMSAQINIVFWGTPEFALPSLKALLDHGWRVAAVVTNPDERIGRKQIVTPPPMKTVALRHGLRVLQPINPISIKRDLAELSPALFVVAAYGKILPKEVLDIPPHGALNIHPSLLPRWRGPSPIQSTILNGDAETGITIIKMDEQMDHGPIVAQRRIKYQVSSIKYKKLHMLLAEEGARLLIEILPKWLRGEIPPVTQDESKATYSKILTKDDGRIDWSKPAEDIERMVRALNPWPGTWTIWPTADRPLRVRIEESEIYPHTKTFGVGVNEVEPRKMAGPPGFVRQAGNGGIAVRTGHGNLVIKKLTLEGKKVTSAAEFMRGHPDFIGAILA